MSSSDATNQHSSQQEQQHLSALPKDKPIVFTNLLRFHKTAQYPSTIPESVSGYLSELPSLTTGAEVYWTRYFPVYHAATCDVLGPDADKLQKVLYKGAPLVPLRFARGKGMASRVSGDGEGREQEDGYWHAVVMTRVESWEVVQWISESDMYKNLGSFHRDAAVEDDELFVSCPVERFEMGVLG